MRDSRSPNTLVTAPREIVGYHGCTQEIASIVLASGFHASTNSFDWLGEGVYIWEYGPYRAREWARERSKSPAVLEITVRLGRCLNLLDRQHFATLSSIYESIARGLPDREIPHNTHTGGHFLDREIIDAYCRLASKETTTPFQTVRGCFPEGEPIYHGSKLFSKAHVQVAVRDLTCISMVLLVQFPL